MKYVEPWDASSYTDATVKNVSSKGSPGFSDLMTIVWA